MREVEQLARQHGAGEAWDKLDTAGRKQWAERVRAEMAAKEPAAAPSLKAQSAAVDRFMAQFWAPVHRERAKKNR